MTEVLGCGRRLRTNGQHALFKVGHVTCRGGVHTCACAHLTWLDTPCACISVVAPCYECADTPHVSLGADAILDEPLVTCRKRKWMIVAS